MTRMVAVFVLAVACAAAVASAAVPAARITRGDAPSTAPLLNPDPPSTLLPAGATSFTLTVQTQLPTRCRYSVGAAAAYAQMTPFSPDTVTTSHNTAIAGIDPAPSVINEVYVRCESSPDYLLHLRYRCLPNANPSYPRTGNLWGWWGFHPKGLDYCARIDLWLGAGFPPADIVALRQINPDILVLTSINTVENSGLPDDYYLKDTGGNRIEVWPGIYRLNLTKPYVAEYQANFAYRAWLDTGLMADGVFFDNFMVAQSWLDEDIHGTPVAIDADENGVEDDADVLDAAWRAGVFRELRAWRRLMPHALASGHVPEAGDPDVAGIFNGDSIGFFTADVLDGKRAFADLWKFYHDWCTLGRAPRITMVESSPHDQIAYGYDYSPLEKIPPSTLEFARTYYPYVRFGIALTLMNDGYFAHEFGDTWHGNDWWYDELDYDLGHPEEPATRIDTGFTTGPDIIGNGGFESALAGTWSMWVNTPAGCAASFERTTSTFAEGAASAHINVLDIGEGVNWHIDFSQADRSYVAGQVYDLSFWAKSGPTTRTITVCSQKGSPDWRNYGLWQDVPIDTQWRHYTVTYEANETVSDARVQFLAGSHEGDVWLDGVRLARHPPDVYRRAFTKGMAMLNGTRERRTLPVPAGYSRIEGVQAPRHQYIVDNSDSAFSSEGGWQATSLDSGEWKSAGPFYHDWGENCMRLPAGTTGTAEWRLEPRGDDTHTIQAWWPAAPESATWTGAAVYELVVAGTVVTSTTLDQRTGGDEWHTITTAALRVADNPVLRLRNAGAGACIADALHVFSASRLNDGQAVTSVTLEPLDGIVLRRTPVLRADSAWLESE